VVSQKHSFRQKYFTSVFFLSAVFFFASSFLTSANESFRSPNHINNTNITSGISEESRNSISNQQQEKKSGSGFKSKDAKCCDGKCDHKKMESKKSECRCEDGNCEHKKMEDKKGCSKCGGECKCDMKSEEKEIKCPSGKCETGKCMCSKVGKSTNKKS